MSDYIKREDAIKSLKESKDRHPSFSGEACAFIIAIQKIKNLHSADVVEVKHGKWIQPHWHNSVHAMNCSVCGGEAQHVEFRGVAKYYSRCPHCSAKMDLED